jgi:peptidoglycan/LPS O-acetylase OafA/YrhL
MAALREWLSPQATLLNSIASGFMILSFLALAGSWVPGAASLSRLGGMAFGIYLMHVPVEEVVARGAYHLTPGLLAFPLAVLVLLTASGLGLPVLAMTVVRHSGLKRAYGYVFG